MSDELKSSYRVRAGSRRPLGASVYEEGVNFSLASRDATRAELLLYRQHDSSEPFQTIELDSSVNRTFIFWHVLVEELGPGVHYTWRVDGPEDAEASGRRYDGSLELVDPWARAVTDHLWDRGNACRHEGKSMRAMVVNPVTAPQSEGAPVWHESYRSQDAIIYELHVGGFTSHPTSGVESHRRGTFAGVIDKIPYLQEMGVTHVELLPVMAFDRQDVPPKVAEMGLENYWGYSPHSFFSPHPHYCQTPEQGTHLLEFREMVDALHDARIEVILDVVFNHTAEAGSDGPTINFKGLGNDIFYHLDHNDRRRYRDYTGCGNTMNCNHPFVSHFLVSCLEFWARDLGVDGFRFDLASVMARDEDGAPMPDPPVIWAIELSPTLSGQRLIAEAWDAVGLYQVGSFPGYRWSEWNGRYRDVMRRFVRGDPGLLSEVATRISGSSDYYQHKDRHPFNSVNFITCHDGFTLYDLVSYNHKRNLPNGEDNQDGHNDNLSWNCGVEGETDDAEVLALRAKQARNFMAILMLSQGLPMILSGDEVLRSQQGNNNGWCQNNEIGWFDWALLDKNRDMLEFTKAMIALRKRHPNLRRRSFLSGKKRGDKLPDIEWHGERDDQSPWDDPISRVLCFTLAARKADESHLHVLMNMSEAFHQLRLPDLPEIRWHLAIDTAATDARYQYAPEHQRIIDDGSLSVLPRSIVVLEGRPG